ncbi:hypothetical protein BO94DRAFT_586202 [Aspergillus sclerotioniger CBS 115572]|uniref:Uncharacterized protein n=1 Tax=Aspergillus sclerotioniger CBS 115572 TaxID=1450535 RepID=A0A317WNI5_9EURO|nr:hypothetical protein BO94DRAFT_586202 [Aspergillus sclerotioniger CBS 115572]PWY86617.1 hypothetical protein BO94DRAFT_586202 [Aspergillus sclerotioniger CBS 115572]
MYQVVAQVQSLVENGGEATRKTIIGTLRNLSCSLESLQDMMQSIPYLSKEPVTTEQLVAKTNSATTLLGRIPRYLASVNTIQKVAINISIADSTAIVGSIGRVIWALPGFLQSTKYQDTLQKAMNTDILRFILMQSMPEKSACHPS